MNCRRPWGRFVAPATLLLIFAAPCISQTDPCRDRVVVVSVRQNVPGSQTGPVKNMDPITDLTAENFRVSAPGHPVVRTAEFHAQPGNVVLLLDVGQNPKEDWKSLLTVAGDLAASLSPDIELDLITFSDRVEQKSSFHKDRQSFLAALSQLVPAGNRSSEDGLLAAVREGLAILNPPQPGDVEFFLSAALVTGDKKKHERRKLEELLTLSGVRLFGVAFGEQNLNLILNGKPVSGIAAANQVDEHSGTFTSSSEILAYYTGGVAFRVFGTPTSRKLLIERPEAKALAGSISNFYVLDLGISEPNSQTGKLEIKLQNNKHPGTFRLWHTIHLFPCPQPSAP